MPVGHCYNVGQENFAEQAAAVLAGLADLHPFGSVAQWIIHDMARSGARDQGWRYFWRQPLDRPAIGETTTIGFYADRAGSLHFRVDVLRRKLEKGPSRGTSSSQKGIKAAQWVWPELAWRPGDDKIPLMSLPSRQLLDAVDAEPMDVVNWMVFKDAIEEDPGLMNRDRTLALYRIQVVIDRLKELEGHVKEAERLAAAARADREAVMAAETYEQREEREAKERGKLAGASP